MRPGIYGSIRAKIARALRNGTGCTLSNEDVVAILHSEAWVAILNAEMAELRELNPVDPEGFDER